MLLCIFAGVVVSQELASECPSGSPGCLDVNDDGDGTSFLYSPEFYFKNAASDGCDAAVGSYYVPSDAPDTFVPRPSRFTCCYLEREGDPNDALSLCFVDRSSAYVYFTKNLPGGGGSVDFDGFPSCGSASATFSYDTVTLIGADCSSSVTDLPAPATDGPCPFGYTYEAISEAVLIDLSVEYLRSPKRCVRFATIGGTKPEYCHNGCAGMLDPPGKELQGRCALAFGERQCCHDLGGPLGVACDKRDESECTGEADEWCGDWSERCGPDYALSHVCPTSTKEIGSTFGDSDARPFLACRSNATAPSVRADFSSSVVDAGIRAPKEACYVSHGPFQCCTVSTFGESQCYEANNGGDCTTFLANDGILSDPPPGTSKLPSNWYKCTEFDFYSTECPPFYDLGATSITSIDARFDPDGASGRVSRRSGEDASVAKLIDSDGSIKFCDVYLLYSPRFGLNSDVGTYYYTFPQSVFSNTNVCALSDEVHSCCQRDSCSSDSREACAAIAAASGVLTSDGEPYPILWCGDGGGFRCADDNNFRFFWSGGPEGSRENGISLCVPFDPDAAPASNAELCSLSIGDFSECANVPVVLMSSPVYQKLCSNTRVSFQEYITSFPIIDCASLSDDGDGDGDTSSGLGTGAIVGIVCGSVAGVGILLFVLWPRGSRSGSVV